MPGLFDALLATTRQRHPDAWKDVWKLWRAMVNASRTIHLTIALSFLGWLFCFTLPATAGDEEKCETILVVLGYIEEHDDDRTRDQFVDILSRLLVASPQCGDQPLVMKGLIPLVGDPDDYIKTVIAFALEDMGRYAVPAVPALEQSLANARNYLKDHDLPVVGNGPWWGDATLSALEKISGNKYPPLK